MGVLEKLNQNPKLGFGVGAAILIIASGIFAFQLSGGSSVSLPTQAFYTDDDGKTFFTDSIDKLPPFDHNGKKALRADVFKCEQGHQFVGLVYRFTDIGRKEMERYLADKPRDPEGSLRTGIERRQMQVKKPSAGDKSWVTNDESVTESLSASMKCPQGHPARHIAP